MYMKLLTFGTHLEYNHPRRQYQLFAAGHKHLNVVTVLCVGKSSRLGCVRDCCDVWSTPAPSLGLPTIHDTSESRYVQISI